jgi:hypothetical protein
VSGAASGVPGLEATHGWFDLAGGVRVTLNEFSAWPYFKLLSLPGFFDGPDADDNRLPRTGTYGESLLASYARGKTVGYVGVILGRTRDECLVGKTTLAWAFGPHLPGEADPGLNPERRMVITPASANVDPGDPAPSGLTHTFVGACVPGSPKIDDQPPKAIERGEPAAKWGLPFQIQLRITDGLFYEWSGSAQSNPKWA